MPDYTEKTIRILRQQAWERAKGELRSILVTYYQDDSFDPMNEAVTNFIEKVEDNGWQE